MSGLLILNGQEESPVQLAVARAKRLHVYTELSPAPGSIKKIEWERVVVGSNEFGADLPPDRILSIGRMPIAVRSVPAPLLSVARVAGFDSLAFGMPPIRFPLLWVESPEILMAAGPLSDYSTARFAPAKAWKPVVRFIVRWLGAPLSANRLVWEPAVMPAYRADEALRPRFEAVAASRGAAWFSKSRLILKPQDLLAYNDADRWNDRVGPTPVGNGDGRLGILEGYSSAIDTHGDQPVRYYRRADCNAESAMALSLAGSPGQRAIGENIADFIALKSDVLHRDPDKQSYGLVGWNDLPNNRGTFYGDDNARYILGLIGAAGANKTSRWDDQILRCILANFRTTGKLGFRGDALSEGEIESLGWRHFFEAPTVNMAPHFEGYLWALYLWAYQKTGYLPLRDRAEAAIKKVIEAGEDAWTWTNGSQQERARMLLPLSWLVRVDDTDEHRAWLKAMVAKVIAYQDKSGGIREEFGDLSRGIAGPPRTNEAFGTGETPLIQENGDPLADMLYTSNFAFLGLHEAAAVTHDPQIQRAEDRLAEFLCRIQIRSREHPEFDGAWFRAFDFGDWDYWASNADLGWGAWSIETGWSVAWITSVLALRQRRLAFWDVHPGFNPDLGLIEQMLKQ
ncbi:MAG: hypothetical protein P4L46_06705 [Fimbriimonas sp.]|nr:hypothetical protein [Fimbriimonas sp.]